MELVKSESRGGIGRKRKNYEENKTKDQPTNVTPKDAIAQLESLFYIPQDFSTQVHFTLKMYYMPAGQCIIKHNIQLKFLKRFDFISTLLCRLIAKGGKRLKLVQKRDFRWLRAFQIFPWISDVTEVIFSPSLLVESVIKPIALSEKL